MGDLWITGFDSAWGGTQKGAICDLHIDTETLKIEMTLAPMAVSWAEAVKRVTEYASFEHHIIAIDQGLIVPNREGMRPVERLLAKALGSMHCSAYPSNRSNRSCFGDQAGIWAFQDVLYNRGYSQNSLAIPLSTRGRFFFECYPHPAIIGMLGLSSILKYKCRHRNLGDWNRLLDFLRSLPIEGLTSHLGLLSRQTKGNEDKIDSIVCAYVGYLWWAFGTSRSSMIGNPVTGYMVTPHTSEMLNRFESVFKGDLNNRDSVPAGIPLASSACHPSVAPNPELSSVSGVQAPCAETDTEWSEAVELVATDTSNFSRTMRKNSRSVVINDWLDRFSGHRLWVKFLDEDGEPEVAFVPHTHSDQQMTLMPDRDSQPGLWFLMVAGASKATPLRFKVRYRFQPLH